MGGYMQRRPAAAVVLFVDVNGAFFHGPSVIQRNQPQHSIHVAVSAGDMQGRDGLHFGVAYDHV